MSMNLVSTFQERLKLALSNVKACQLAENIGISKQAISMYVAGKRTPKRPTIEALARELGVNPLWLLGYDEPKYIEKPTTVSSDGLDPEHMELLKSLSKADLDIVLSVARQMKQRENQSEK